MNIIKFFYSSFGRALAVLATYGLLVFLTRVLGKAESGGFYVAFAFLSIAVVIGRLGQDVVLVRDGGVAWRDKNRRMTMCLFSKGATVIFCASVILGIALFFTAKGIVSVFPENQHLLTTLRYFSFSVPFIGISWLIGGLYKAVGLPGLGALVESGGIPIFTVCLVWLFCGPSATIEEVAISVLISSFLTCAFAAAFILYKFRLFAEFRFVSVSAKKINGTSIMWLQLCTTLSQWSGVLVVGVIVSDSASSIFNTANRTSMLIALALVAGNALMMPRIAHLWSMQNKRVLEQEIRKTIKILLVCVSPLAVLLLVWPSEFLAFFFGSQFTSGATALRIMTLGQLVNVATGPVAVTLLMCHKEREAGIVCVITAFATITFMPIFVLNWGVNGAAIANLIAVCVQNVALTLLVYKRLKLRPFLRSRIDND